MTEKEMIEEMAKAIRSVLTSRVDIVHIPDLDKPIAEELLKHYQPKIPEGAVVLTREEYEKLKSLSTIEEIALGAVYDNTRKETAREIIGEIKSFVHELDLLVWIDAIAKEFGVEVEE